MDSVLLYRKRGEKKSATRIDISLTIEMTGEFAGDNRPKMRENGSYPQSKLKISHFSLDTVRRRWYIKNRT